MDGLRAHGVGTEAPLVNSCPEGNEARGVGIGEVIGVLHAYRPVIAGTRSRAPERSPDAGEAVHVAAGLVSPGAGGIGHEADPVDAVPVIKALGSEMLPVVGEHRRDRDAHERISRRGAVECHLERAPAGDRSLRDKRLRETHHGDACQPYSFYGSMTDSMGRQISFSRL